MFSQTSEYTLRVVVFLARLRGKPATNRQIAAATRVPEGYLAKILQSLSRARLVRSQRGLRGGSSLLRDPDQITVYEVMEVASPMPRIHQCPLGLASHGAHLCPLHRKLDDAMAMVENAFRATVITDLIDQSDTEIVLGDLGDDPEAARRAAEVAFPVKPIPLGLPRKRTASPARHKAPSGE
jgi:Rrf2 family protein